MICCPDIIKLIYFEKNELMLIHTHIYIYIYNTPLSLVEHSQDGSSEFCISPVISFHVFSDSNRQIKC